MQDATLLITGGTGSFGNAVLGKFIDSSVKEIRILSRDEKKQDEMRRSYNNPKIKFFIGDVRNKDSLDSAMKGVDLVFSAAALKQVPSCEFYPLEAVYTNVIGSGHTIASAIEHGVRRVVVLSTDKAVYPINAMGMSKALMEKVAIAKSRALGEHETVISVTRYGNVMASRGSVIPLFIEQIKSGRPLTVTDPNMTRFMMSLDEAVELVVFAFTNARQGDVFVKKAPAATVAVLAECLLEIFHANNEIRIIGTRHGEKLYETLLSREEAASAEDLGEFYRIPVDDRDLNYGRYVEVGDASVSDAGEFNSHNTHRMTRNELKQMLLGLKYIQDELTGV